MHTTHTQSTVLYTVYIQSTQIVRGRNISRIEEKLLFTGKKFRGKGPSGLLLTVLLTGHVLVHCGLFRHRQISRLLTLKVKDQQRGGGGQQAGHVQVCRGRVTFVHKNPRLEVNPRKYFHLKLFALYLHTFIIVHRIEPIFTKVRNMRLLKFIH